MVGELRSHTPQGAAKKGKKKKLRGGGDQQPQSFPACLSHGGITTLWTWANEIMAPGLLAALAQGKVSILPEGAKQKGVPYLSTASPRT